MNEWNLFNLLFLIDIHFVIYLSFIHFIAGVLGMASQSFEQWEKCIQVNLLSVMALCSHAIQYLEKNESSSSSYFINIDCY